MRSDKGVGMELPVFAPSAILSVSKKVPSHAAKEDLDGQCGTKILCRQVDLRVWVQSQRTLHQKCCWAVFLKCFQSCFASSGKARRQKRRTKVDSSQFLLLQTGDCYRTSSGYFTQHWWWSFRKNAFGRCQRSIKMFSLFVAAFCPQLQSFWYVDFDGRKLHDGALKTSMSHGHMRQKSWSSVGYTPKK